ncbi:MAG: hypothetical protein AAGC73_01650 [Verrucomicrobiota bacterium]
MALAKALDEFLENRRQQAFLQKVLAGGTDYQASNDELEEISRLET